MGKLKQKYSKKMPKIDQNGIKRREKNTKYQLNILFSVYVQSRPMKKFKKYLNQKINLNIFEILSKIYIFKIHFWDTSK